MPKIYKLMKLVHILIGLLAISSIAFATSHDGSVKPRKATAARGRNLQATTKQVTADARLNALLARLDEIKASLLKCESDKAHCTISLKLTRRLRKQKRVVRRYQKSSEASAKRRALKAKKATLRARIAKLKAHPEENAREIRRSVHRLRRYTAKQERYRVRASYRLTRRIKRVERKLERSSRRVKYCLENKKSKGCKRTLKVHFRRLRHVRTMRSSRARLNNKITISRQRHVRTFKNIRSIRVKQIILTHKYNLKARYYERGIERLEKLELKYRSEENQTPCVQKKIASISKVLTRLRSKVHTLEEEKSKIATLNTSDACSQSLSCAANLHKILNVIHINLVMRSNGQNRVVSRKTIVTRGHVTMNTEPKQYKPVQSEGDVVDHTEASTRVAHTPAPTTVTHTETSTRVAHTPGSMRVILRRPDPTTVVLTRRASKRIVVSQTPASTRVILRRPESKTVVVSHTPASTRVVLKTISAANPNDVVREENVQIRTAHGSYVRAYPGGQGARVGVDRRVSSASTWTIQHLRNGKVAIKSIYGTFLRSHPGGQGARLDLDSQIGAWSLFDIIRNGDGTVCFKSLHNTFFRATPGSHIDMQVWMKGWEMFRLVRLG